MKFLLPFVIATVSVFQYTAASTIPPPPTTQNSATVLTRNAALSKRGYPSIPSKKSVVTIPDVNGSPFTMTFNFRYHDYDASMPAIGPTSFNRGYQKCLTEFKQKLFKLGTDLQTARQGYQGNFLPLSTTELVSLGGEVRPQKETWFECQDDGIPGVENGFKMIIGPTHGIKASMYPSWAEVGVAIQGLKEGMDRKDRLFANAFHLYLPSKGHGALQAVGLDRFGALNSIYGIGRSEIVHGKVEVIFQGGHAIGDRGPKGRGKGWWVPGANGASRSGSGSGAGNVRNLGNGGDTGGMGSTSNTGNAVSMGNTADMGNAPNVGNAADMSNAPNMGNAEVQENAPDMGHAPNVGSASNMQNAGVVGNVPNMGNTADMGNAPNMGNVGAVGNAPNMGNTADMGNAPNTGNANIMGNTGNVGNTGAGANTGFGGNMRSPFSDTPNSFGRRPTWNGGVTGQGF